MPAITPPTSASTDNISGMPGDLFIRILNWRPLLMMTMITLMVVVVVAVMVVMVVVVVVVVMVVVVVTMKIMVTCQLFQRRDRRACPQMSPLQSFRNLLITLIAVSRW